MRDLTEISRKSASSAKKDIIDSLSTLLKERFRDFDNGIYDVMSFFDPNNWSDERDYGNIEVISRLLWVQVALIKQKCLQNGEC